MIYPKRSPNPPASSSSTFSSFLGSTLAFLSSFFSSVLTEAADTDPSLLNPSLAN